MSVCLSVCVVNVSLFVFRYYINAISPNCVAPHSLLHVCPAVRNITADVFPLAIRDPYLSVLMLGRCTIFVSAFVDVLLVSARLCRFRTLCCCIIVVNRNLGICSVSFSGMSDYVFVRRNGHNHPQR